MKKKPLLFVVLIAIIGISLFTAVGCEVDFVTYQISFDLSGGTMEQTSLTVNEDETIDLTQYVPQKENYEFIGWMCGGEIVTEIIVTENTTFIAQWKEILTINCNVESAEIVNDVIAFEVKSSGDAELTVTFNGNNVNIEEGGLCTITLEKGLNTIVVNAVSGEVTAENTYEIDYKGFTVVTDLYNLTTGDSVYTFGATAFYGDEKCETEVKLDGRTLECKADNYALTFTDSKVYEVAISAIGENARYTEVYSVTYDSTLPRFAQMTLATNKEYRGETVAFTLTATDAEGTKLADKNVAFYADFDSDDDNDEFIALTSSEISTVWSDSNATSYKLHTTSGMFANSLNKTVLLKAVLTSGDKTAERLYRIRYIGPDADGCIGEIVVSIEGFTIGVGYILEPTIVKIYKDGKFPVYLKELVEEKGWTMDYTGKLESGFYLSMINGLNIPENAVNARLAEVLDENHMTVDEMSIMPETDGTYSLGEFCYNYFSGWMYSINGMFANYGMADYDPVDGDVVRIGFTLAYGADIGGAAAMGGFMPAVSENDADYFEFNTTVARIITANYNGKERTKLDEVLAVVAEWDVAQNVVDEATKTLKEYYF